MTELPMTVFGKTLGKFEIKLISRRPLVSEFIVPDSEKLRLFKEMYPFEVDCKLTLETELWDTDEEKIFLLKDCKFTLDRQGVWLLSPFGSTPKDFVVTCPQ